jgi:transcriptional regulator with XRE-family HTH domain
MDPVEDEIAGDRTGRRMLDYEHGGPTVLRMLIGLRLRRLREEAGVSREAAARTIHVGPATMDRLEMGRAGAKQRDVADLLVLYRVANEDDRAELLAMVNQARLPAWWQPYSDVVPAWFEPYLGLEQAAQMIRCYEVGFIPGLLQTADYARAVIHLDRSLSDDDVERRVQLRMGRSQLLDKSNPPKLWAVIDESVLYRPYGGLAVLRAQLQHLAEVAELTHITVQVMPFGADDRPAAGAPITILRFPEPELPDVVYVEKTSTALYPYRAVEMDHYWHVMNHLVTQACQPAQTKNVIRRVLAELS